MLDIYQDKHPNIFVQKSAQCSVSEWLINISLWLSICYRYNTILVQPTDHVLSDFIRGRVDPVIQDSDYLRSKINDTDNVGLKRVGKSFIYFRGSQGGDHKLKSVDADCMLYDELDELRAGTMARGKKRLGHSRLKWVRAVSTPTYPEEGIDAEYKDSDQMHWFLKCPHCNEYQTPTFAENIRIETATFHCKKCKREIDRLAMGRWIPAHPDHEKRGYFINKLFCERTDLKELVDNSKKQSQYEIQEFFNSDLGLAYAPKGNRLSKADLLSCRDCDLHNPSIATHCSMGVDVGTMLNVRISYNEGGTRKCVYVGVMTDFEDLDRLMSDYCVDVCVIDANPETRKAKEFQERNIGRVYLAYYWPSDDKRTELCEVQEDDDGVDVIKINRTQAADCMVNQIQKRKNILPHNIEDTMGYTSQMMAPLRIVKKNSRGDNVAVYEEFGKPDHYFHAEIYDYIAGKVQNEEGVNFVGDEAESGAKRDIPVYTSGEGRDTANMDW